MEKVQVLVRETPPVFAELRVEGKKKKRLFRHWGAVRLVSDGHIKIIQEEGYERAHSRTHKKNKRGAQNVPSGNSS